MLRSKKYNTYKHVGLNHLFDFCVDEPIPQHTDDSDGILIDDYMRNLIINSNDHYDLVKETILEPYILKLHNILLIHLNYDVIREFEFLYKKSNKHVFDIYETSHPHMREDDTYIKTYHIFCVSQKLSDDINYMSFLKTNDSDKKYSCLSLFYGPCLIVNRRFDITCEHDKYKSKYKYVKSIGRGKVDESIRSFIKVMINMTNEYQKILPPHYLKMN